MTSRGALSPLKPKPGLNGPPKALVAGADAESFFTQLATGNSTVPNEQTCIKQARGKGVEVGDDFRRKGTALAVPQYAENDLGFSP